MIETTAWVPFPDGTYVPEQVFAIADVHGRADLLEPLLAHLEALPRRDRRHMVFTGDLNDRGPESLRAIHLAWGAKTRFENWTYLPGNHEINLWNAIMRPHVDLGFRWWLEAYEGKSVCREIDPDGRMDVDALCDALRAGLPDGFLDHIGNTPGHVKIGDLLFVHAGIPPIGDREKFLALGPLEDHPRGMHWAFIRHPFLIWKNGWDPCGKGRTIVVHGHTIENDGPLKSAQSIMNRVDRTIDRRRINLDTGATYFGHLVALEAHENKYRFHLLWGREWEN